MRKLLFLASFCVLFATAPAVGDAITDWFYTEVDMDGHLISAPGSGSGYEDGTWYYYTVTDWWNQWFYDHPPQPDRWKEISTEGYLSAL